jgi:hypothetical protein
VVHAILANQFWIHAQTERGDQQIQARAQSMLERSNPAYLRPLPG